MNYDIAVVIPAFNEGDAIGQTIERVRAVALTNGWNAEIVVVDDGSTDNTAAVAREFGVSVVQHPTNGGYGISLQHGIATTTAPYIAITDADGTYPVEELPKLLALVREKGFDMAVGARQGTEYRKGFFKYPARILFRLFAEYVAGRRIPDINSGLRVMRRVKLMPHLHRTCFGFSFTTSITLIFFLNGFFVTYMPVSYVKRVGTSKVHHFHDTLRTAQILVSVICAYNPLKLFLLIAAICGIVGLVSTAVALGTDSTAAWIFAGIFFAAAPVIFALGCLAESVRRNLTKES